MRIALGKFLDMNKETIYNEDNYIIIDFLSHNAYKSEKEKIFNMTGFIEENILSMQNEAEQLMYYLAPIVFNINLDLYVLEGSINNDPNNTRFLKEIMNCQNEENTERLILLYRLTNFDIIYTNNWYTANKDILDYFITTEITQRRIKELGSIKCEQCKTQSVSIELSDDKIESTCKDCLISFMKERMMLRVKNYITENFNNLECK